MAVIKSITDSIEAVEGVKLLDVDPGAATNRTVVTFVGTPEAVVEAAFQGVRRAAELIDRCSMASWLFTNAKIAKFPKPAKLIRWTGG